MTTAVFPPAVGELSHDCEDARQQNGRILVVEDDLDAQANLRDVLELDGYEVDCLSSIAELQSYAGLPSLSFLILDRNLPDGKAETLLPEIRRKAPQTTILVVTGFADLDSAITSLRNGAKDYILKPINPDALRLTLGKLRKDQETQKKLEQAERLAAVGQMMASVSHESKNELFVIKMALELVEAEVADNPRIDGWITEMRGSCSRLERLLEDIKAHAGPVELERCAFPLRLSWQRAWRQLEAQSKGRRVRFHRASNCQGVTAFIDPFRTEQVFRNLFENSLQACPDPVRIEISCTDTVLDGEQAVRISVRDNGPGLGHMQRQQVFEPFFTTKNRGTGLGMAIVKRIVEAHGGMIQIGDYPDGAELLITLPVGSDG